MTVTSSPNGDRDPSDEKIGGGKSDRKMSKEDHVLDDVFDMATGV
jgi:hypothetical protein